MNAQDGDAEIKPGTKIAERGGPQVLPQFDPIGRYYVSSTLVLR